MTPESRHSFRDSAPQEGDPHKATNTVGGRHPDQSVSPRDRRDSFPGFISLSPTPVSRRPKTSKIPSYRKVKVAEANVSLRRHLEQNLAPMPGDPSLTPQSTRAYQAHRFIGAPTPAHPLSAGVISQEPSYTSPITAKQSGASIAMASATATEVSTELQFRSTSLETDLRNPELFKAKVDQLKREMNVVRTKLLNSRRNESARQGATEESKAPSPPKPISRLPLPTGRRQTKGSSAFPSTPKKEDNGKDNFETIELTPPPVTPTFDNEPDWVKLDDSAKLEAHEGTVEVMDKPSRRDSEHNGTYRKWYKLYRRA